MRRIYHYSTKRRCFAARRKFASQISLRGVEICQDTRPSNQPSLYKIAIPDKVRERKYPWIYCCGATLSMGEGAAGAFITAFSYSESCHLILLIVCLGKDVRARGDLPRKSLCAATDNATIPDTLLIFPHMNQRYPTK